MSSREAFEQYVVAHGFTDLLSVNWQTELTEWEPSDLDKQAAGVVTDAVARCRRVAQRADNDAPPVADLQDSTLASARKLYAAIQALRTFVLSDDADAALDDISLLQCAQLFDTTTRLFESTYRTTLDQASWTEAVAATTRAMYAIAGGTEQQIKTSANEIVIRRTVPREPSRFAKLMYRLKIAYVFVATMFAMISYTYSFVTFLQADGLGVVGSYIPFSPVAYVAAWFGDVRPYGNDPWFTNPRWWLGYHQASLPYQTLIKQWRHGALANLGNIVSSTVTWEISNWIGFNPIKLTLFLVGNFMLMHMIETLLDSAATSARAVEQTIVVRADNDDDDGE